MLQTLRNNTRIILWFVVIAFVGFIILVWGADLQFGKQGTAGAVGWVNGQEIPYQTYQRRLTANLQALRARGDREPTLEDERRVADQTWQQMIDEILVSQAAAKRALPLSDDEVVFWVRQNPPDELRQNPAFIDTATGQINVAVYQEALRRTPEMFTWYEELTRLQLPMSKLERAVLSAAKVSEGDVDAFVRDRYENMRASFLWIDPRNFPASSTEISDAEARAYYEAHPEDFKVGERAQLVVVRLPKTPSETDENEVLEDVRGFISTIRAGDVTFAGIAESFSQDAFAAQGGDRGRYMQKREVEPELADQVFALALGQVSEPIRIANRVILVQVTADSVIGGEPARRFATIEQRITPGAETLTELRGEARTLVDQAKRHGMAAAAASAGVEADTTALFERNSFSPLLTGAREAVEWAFQHPKGAVGTPIETENDFVIFQVEDRRPAETLPFDEVRTRVDREVLRSRQHELARTKAERVIAAVKAAGALEAAARAETLEVRDSNKFARKGYFGEVGADPELIGKSFALSVGAISDLIETDKGFFVVRADSLFPPEPADRDRQRQTARQILERERQNGVLEAWLADMRSRSDIEDRRSRFF